MTQPLITPAEVLALAFTSTESLPEESITPSRIESASLQYIRPALGSLYEHLSDTRYAEFVDTFIKPPLAHYVRYQMIDDHSAQIATWGIMQHKTDYALAATNSQTEHLRRQARNDAEQLLQKAITQIETHPADYPEYDPKENIRNRVVLKGGFVL